MLFIHIENMLPSLKIVKPDFDSKLTSTIIELEKLRIKKLGGPVHPHIFFQLKEIFQLLESLGSARIEGNNTTLAEAIENQINKPKNPNDKQLEIMNGEKAMSFVEEFITPETSIDKLFILELHKIVVGGLAAPPGGEGSAMPGQLRRTNVRINKSSLLPPDFTQVIDHFDELIKFINQGIDKKYNLLVTAIAHHRFSAIHPFDNGNGRVVRLLTYAMLIQQGFNVHSGRILNPTAIFCINRDKYYEMLAKADSATDEGILAWCTYVLEGLFNEIIKIDKLLDRPYLIDKILIPALNFALDDKLITKAESEILRTSLQKGDMEMVSADLEKIFPGKHPVERSRIIKKLREKKMLQPVKKEGRKYIICFSNNYLLREVIKVLKNENFVAVK